MYNVCPYNIYVSLYVKKQYMGESNRQATDVEMRRRLIQPLCGKNSTCLCAALIERVRVFCFIPPSSPITPLAFRYHLSNRKHSPHLMDDSAEARKRYL
ncbi:hypothetical protein OUZ56_001622 [Daphnia magna]|uniref:Uncharacterized protein n=1 Tax=Daphnia magna TaxID=35525 RepID=A0ABR0A375_9CRUS|nr:hypothetical protein OUZ56_001622 [Daphnia magna]